jgi:hypothetical protein
MNKVVLDELLRVLLERIGIREENGFSGDENLNDIPRRAQMIL